MKRKKIALILSISMLISAASASNISAEDLMLLEGETEMEEAEKETENVTETVAAEDVYIVNDEEQTEKTFQTDQIADNDEFTDTITIETIENVEPPMQESDVSLDVTAETELSNETDEQDNVYNLKNYAAYVEKNNIFVFEDAADTLCVYDLNGTVQKLDAACYHTLGYITEAMYKEENGELEHLDTFKERPDSEGVWFLVFEGTLPYYGRQAAEVTVHDTYDLSAYSWTVDSGILAEEDPRDSLQIFLEYGGETIWLNAEDYEVLGYVTEADYAEANGDFDKISAYCSKPEEAGNWLIVVEGVGAYHGKLAGWTTVKDKYDLSLYQCQVLTETISADESIEDYIQVSYDGYNEYNLSADDYRVTGYVKEKDFIDCGYDLNNSEILRECPDSDGGWYFILEGTGTYYGKLVGWFEVEQMEIPDDNSEQEIILE